MTGWVEVLLRKPGTPPLGGCEDIRVSATRWLSDYQSVAGKLPMAEFECAMDVVCLFSHPLALIRRPMAQGDIINLCFTAPKQGTQGLLLIEIEDLPKFTVGRFRYNRDPRTNLVLVELKIRIPSLAP
jgi:hypothetical protein